MTSDAVALAVARSEAERILFILERHVKKRLGEHRRMFDDIETAARRIVAEVNSTNE